MWVRTVRRIAGLDGGGQLLGDVRGARERGHGREVERVVHHRRELADLLLDEDVVVRVEVGVDDDRELAVDLDLVEGRGRRRGPAGGGAGGGLRPASQPRPASAAAAGAVVAAGAAAGAAGLRPRRASRPPPASRARPAWPGAAGAAVGFAGAAGWLPHAARIGRAAIARPIRTIARRDRRRPVTPSAAMPGSCSPIRILLETTSTVHGRQATGRQSAIRYVAVHTSSNEVVTTEPNGGSRATRAEILCDIRRATLRATFRLRPSHVGRDHHRRHDSPHRARSKNRRWRQKQSAMPHYPDELRRCQGLSYPLVRGDFRASGQAKRYGRRRWQSGARSQERSVRMPDAIDSDAIRTEIRRGGDGLMARRPLFARDSCRTGSSRQPFTLPAVRPATMNFWPSM